MWVAFDALFSFCVGETVYYTRVNRSDYRSGSDECPQTPGRLLVLAGLSDLKFHISPQSLRRKGFQPLDCLAVEGPFKTWASGRSRQRINSGGDSRSRGPFAGSGSFSSPWGLKVHQDVSHVHWAAQVFGPQLMNQPVAAGVAGGSVASLASWILWAIDRPLAVPPPGLLTCPVCPELPELDLLFAINLRSLGIGILVGLTAGPLLDVVCIVRHSWRGWVRQRFGSLTRLAAARGGPISTSLIYVQG